MFISREQQQRNETLRGKDKGHRRGTHSEGEEARHSNTQGRGESEGHK